MFGMANPVGQNAICSGQHFEDETSLGCGPLLIEEEVAEAGCHDGDTPVRGRGGCYRLRNVRAVSPHHVGAPDHEIIGNVVDDRVGVEQVFHAAVDRNDDKIGGRSSRRDRSLR